MIFRCSRVWWNAGKAGSGGFRSAMAPRPRMAEAATAETAQAAETATSVMTTPSGDNAAPTNAATQSEPSIQSTHGPRKPARYGLAIQFETRAGEPELGRLVDSTVFVNDAHPAYQRAAASRSEGYHLAPSVAMALAPLAVEPQKERAFVTKFLKRWGDALTGARGR